MNSFFHINLFFGHTLSGSPKQNEKYTIRPPSLPRKKAQNATDFTDFTENEFYISVKSVESVAFLFENVFGMTMRIMISVVSADEAREAMLGGAEILDVKNPEEGSLGAQFPRIIQEVKNIASGKVEISAAIGDLPNLPGTAALAALGAAFCGAGYVKAGLYGPRSEAEAIALLREVKHAVEQFGSLVIAAGYADFNRSGTMDPECLPRVAAMAGVKGCLLDTYIKDDKSLFHFLDPQALWRLAQRAHEAGLLFGLAGGLCQQDLPVVRDLGADVVGFRTAVCRGNKRNGALDLERVRRLLGNAENAEKRGKNIK
jgi:(5-formylfuran-3-yl)methyl phosphate synthase